MAQPLPTFYDFLELFFAIHIFIILVVLFYFTDIFFCKLILLHDAKNKDFVFNCVILFRIKISVSVNIVPLVPRNS